MEKWSLKLVREPVAESFQSIFTKVNTADDVASIAQYILKDESVEVVLAFYLNNRLVIIGWHEVSRGIVDASLIHPREVFKAALLANASAVILVHNHPSGDSSPSVEDRRISESLSKAADLLGIRFLDNVVVGQNTFHSAM